MVATVTFSDGLVHTEVKKKELYIKCQCGGEILNLSQYEGEEEVYLTVYQYLSDRYSFWERLSILFGGKVRTCDLVLSKEDFKKIKEWKNKK